MPSRGKRTWKTKRRLGFSRYPDARRLVFENFECGSSIEEIIEQYDVTREQIITVLEFAARSLDAPPIAVDAVRMFDAHPL